jgi:hypothetical protein
MGSRNETNQPSQLTLSQYNGPNPQSEFNMPMPSDSNVTSITSPQNIIGGIKRNVDSNIMVNHLRLNSTL